MYLRKEYDLGNVRFIEKHYPGNYGAPGMKRRKKKEPTPEDVKKQNDKRKARRLQMLILRNFMEGDWYLTLTYRKEERPESIEEAKKQRKKFIRDLRKQYRKAGHELKYIIVTERGERGACHHHIIIQDITDGSMNVKKAVMDCWKYGGKHFEPLYEDGNYERLAEYISKTATKEEQKGGRTFARSQNLIVPEPKVEKIHAGRWAWNPKAPVGWYIVKDSLENGENIYTGKPYQRYIIRRLVAG